MSQPPNNLHPRQYNASPALDRAMGRLKALRDAGYQFAQAVYAVSRELDIDPHKIFAESSRRSAAHRAAQAISRRGGKC